MKAAKLIMESGSSGTRHILEYARGANVTKVIYTGSFANVLHPYDSWSPIIVTENGKITERLGVACSHMSISFS